MQELITAYRHDADGWYLGEDKIMAGMVPPDDVMAAPTVKDGYWQKWTGKKWTQVKKPSTCAEAVEAGLSVISNAPDAHSREVVALIDALVETEKDKYRRASTGGLEAHIEAIPEKTEEEKALDTLNAEQSALDAQISDLKDQLLTATLAGDTDAVKSIKAEYSKLMEAY